MTIDKGEVIALYQLRCWYGKKQEKREHRNTNITLPYRRVSEATQHYAETRDPPSQDPHDHIEQSQGQRFSQVVHLRYLGVFDMPYREGLVAASISSVVTWLSVNRVIDVAKRLTAASSIAGKLANNVRQGGVPRSAKWLHGLTVEDSAVPLR